MHIFKQGIKKFKQTLRNMKGNSLNNRRQVQSDFLKRVEKLCGEEMAEKMNAEINLHNRYNAIRFPDYVLKSHYRSLSKEVRKPVKYVNKVSK